MSDISDFISKAATFAENVRRELRDLPAETVADLTDGLESDIAASLEDGATLPDASQYALDLMRGAGIEIPKSDANVRLKKRRFAEVTIRIVDKVKSAVSGLAPAWWILRAWIVTQFIGAIVSDVDSNRPIFSQWGEMSVLAIVIFVAALYVSIRIGRSTNNSPIFVRYFATVVLSMSSIVLLWQPTFSPPSAEEKTFMYAPETCRVIDVPSVVGITLGEAKSALERWKLPYTVFDQDAMSEIAYAPDDFEVLQQDPPPGESVFCGERFVQLVVDLSQGPAEQPSTDVLSTTTIPLPSTTTTSKAPKAPKVTTTTTP
jgi:PASTA domain